MVLKTWFGFL